MSHTREVRLFRNGRNQAVWIPVEFELPGETALIHKEGGGMMLDTSIASDLIHNPAGRVAARVRDCGVSNTCVSIGAAAEMWFRAQRQQSEFLRQRADAPLDELSVIPFAPPADAADAVLRTTLPASGRIIGSHDMLIAAHALALVTANTAGFRRVHGRSVENWRD